LFPRDSIFFLIVNSIVSTTVKMVMTANIPIVIPKRDRKVRNLFTTIAWKANK
jgi:hypothetical protein